MKNSLAKKPSKSQVEYKVEIGDIFLLGDHLLYCWDSRHPDIWKRLLREGQRINLLLTDPPYWIDYVESKKGFTGTTEKFEDIPQDGIQSDREYAQFTRDWIAPMLPYFAEKNASYIFNADKMIFALREWMLQAGMRFTQLLIWVKDSAIIGRLDYLPQHELIAYGWYGKHAFYGWKAKSILPFARVRKNTIHPTMKPIPLLRELILNSSKRGDTVYDPFGGSWSTLIASEQTGRKCVMVEINPVYCLAIIHRWEEYTGKTVEKIT